MSSKGLRFESFVRIKDQSMKHPKLLNEIQTTQP